MKSMLEKAEKEKKAGFYHFWLLVKNIKVYEQLMKTLYSAK